jgi:hypothetical protein
MARRKIVTDLKTVCHPMQIIEVPRNILFHYIIKKLEFLEILSDPTNTDGTKLYDGGVFGQILDEHGDTIRDQKIKNQLIELEALCYKYPLVSVNVEIN